MRNSDEYALKDSSNLVVIFTYFNLFLVTHVINRHWVWWEIFEHVTISSINTRDVFKLAWLLTCHVSIETVSSNVLKHGGHRRYLSYQQSKCIKFMYSCHSVQEVTMQDRARVWLKLSCTRSPIWLSELSYRRLPCKIYIRYTYFKHTWRIMSRTNRWWVKPVGCSSTYWHLDG